MGTNFGLCSGPTFTRITGSFSYTHERGSRAAREAVNGADAFIRRSVLLAVHLFYWDIGNGSGFYGGSMVLRVLSTRFQFFGSAWGARARVRGAVRDYRVYVTSCVCL